jgi:hypothetical protein
MRSVVRLVSELVGSKESDIERHRRTFTFLFTHLDVLTSLTSTTPLAGPLEFRPEYCCPCTMLSTTHQPFRFPLSRNGAGSVQPIAGSQQE